jgi:hypothetical protein
MTAVPKPKRDSQSVKKPFVSSRAWAEERLKTIKLLQDEYLDQYVTDQKESVEMLKLLSKIQQMLERKL